MKKRKKFAVRIREYGQKFYAFFHKKASVPSGCGKKLCHGVVNLVNSSGYLLRFTPGEQSFLTTTQLVK